MNAQSLDHQEAVERRLKRLDIATEEAMFNVLSTKAGRTVLAVVVRGTHNLHNCYSPGMSFDAVTYELGRQHSARELIGVMRASERCSTLFDQALREYDNEWVRNSTSTSGATDGGASSGSTSTGG